MKQPEEKRKLILIEQAWEDESGQYHDEYAELVEINEDGTLKLEFPHSDQMVRDYLSKCEFKAEDYEDQLKEDRCNVPPEGWACTRKPGHDGPCAAIPENWEEGFKKTKFATGGGLSFECSDYEGMYDDLLDFIRNLLKRQRSEVAREILEKWTTRMAEIQDDLDEIYPDNSYHPNCGGILEGITEEYLKENEE